jgi:hypothetical protein
MVLAVRNHFLVHITDQFVQLLACTESRVYSARPHHGHKVIAELRGQSERVQGLLAAVYERAHRLVRGSRNESSTYYPLLQALAVATESLQ